MYAALASDEMGLLEANKVCLCILKAALFTCDAAGISVRGALDMKGSF